MQFKYFMPEDVIISAGEKIFDVYVLLDGEAMVVHDDGTIITSFNKGDHFGEFALLLGYFKRAAHVVASTMTHVGIIQ